jgi:NitT/TauT family transport system permease protein
VNRLGGLIAPWALTALLLAAWEIACRTQDIPPYFLPAPSAVAVALRDHLGVILQSAWQTMAVALIALVLASLIAQALAVVTALSPLADRAIRPLASVVQVTPVIAIAPLVIIWAGLDHPQRPLVTLAALVAFFPMFSGAVAGLKSADPDLERLFDLYGASRWQRVTRLRLPAAVPFLLEGHKVGAGLALIGAVAALVALGIMGVALHALLEALERAGLTWWRGR